MYYQVLQRMDEGVGNVTRALREHGMWDDAVVLFCGDNGGADKNNNYPLRGGKYKPWEGGYRVLAALSGGVVERSPNAGKTFDGAVHISDWFPTFTALAGGDPTDDPPAGNR